MISVDNLAVEFSGHTLFSDVSFTINENDKIALMGKNGAGKSTMMKIIAGVQNATRGNVRCPKEAVIAYLPQHLLTEDNTTVFDEASKAFSHVLSNYYSCTLKFWKRAEYFFDLSWPSSRGTNKDNLFRF